jgi:uridine phosphorylase
MGGPSAAIVISELASLGAELLLRVGTCGALDQTLALGDLVIASEALADDGTSRALGVSDRAAASPEVTAALAETDAARTGLVATTDLFYDDRAGLEQEWAARGAIAIEMETAPLFALAAKRGVLAGALLTVSDVVLPQRVRIGERELRDAERRLGEIAVRALGSINQSLRTS